MNPIDEIKLTAYALGELSAEERRQIEVQLKDSPAQQAAVDEIQSLGAQLEAELKSEPAPELSKEQRNAILGEPHGATQPREAFAWRRLAAIAAVVTLVFGGFFWNASRSLHKELLASLDETGEVAMNNPVDVEMDELRITTAEEIMTAESSLLAQADKGLNPQLPLTEMAGAIGVDMDLEAPEIEDFAAVPVLETVSELNITLDSSSSVIMKNLAPGQLANCSGGIADKEYKIIAGTKREVMELAAVPCASPAMKYVAGSRRITSQSYVGGQPKGQVVRGFRPPYEQQRIEHQNTESYSTVANNPFKQVANEPLSTFSIDVDTASYANIRRFLKAGQMPPPDAVRVEEMINYFSYDYAQPEEEVPFAVHIESATCPWNEAHQLVKIGLKGKELDPETRPPCNLVFLLDVSGSMSSANKLPLVKKALKLLVKQLSPEDRVSIVVYASASGLVLPSTSCDNPQAIESALDQLQSGGSTAGGAGIRLAYDEALKNFRSNGVNRVILCTDGDFNVGITDSGELSSFIAGRAKKGIFLTVLGFGMGNYKDDRLETLADKGNGNYAYIDTFSEARKNLSEQAAGTLFTIAKDVKLQIEFNPAHFDSYRLIGYENRVMAKEDFNNDKKDAGELGAGHTVTAFYELVPKGVKVAPGVDPLKYQAIESAPMAEEQESDKALKASPEWLTVKLRYKLPKEDISTKIEIPFTGTFAPFDSASTDFRFAAGVAAGGLLMRGDTRIGDLTFREVIGWTSATTGDDLSGYRREYLDLLKNAAALAE